ncbi:MAG: hypothetical protein EWV51_18150 [Microcystis panniformis Mp_MB_F_20051200_S6]|nr:MAG: hypothetical protein EWV51_18150 [Microcystis panniformis Mp_MB_F_20051200_S6]
MIVIQRNYLIFWIFINAIAELVADLVVRSFLGIRRGDGFWEEQFLGNGDLDEERRSFLGDVGMAITYRIFLLS